MVSNIPTNQKLYQIVKDEIYTKYPNHSAYRSGLLVKTYKKRFMEKFPNLEPYVSYENSKDINSQGLKRWFSENWTNQRGETGYKYKSDIYRPTRRVTKETPLTFSELSQDEIDRARREKYRKGRITKFMTS
jgi:hypothetical protein